MTLLLENHSLDTSLKEKDPLISREVPKHIAVIMDGNRRWAKRKGLPVSIGHWKGVEAIDNLVKYSIEFGVKILTVYAFSTENWNRSKEEVECLMELFSQYLRVKTPFLIKEGVCLNAIGDLSRFSSSLQKQLNNAIKATENSSKIELILALNYGSRHEITRAVKKIIEDVSLNKIKKQEVTENLISSYLDTSKWCDPELLIRTSGEKRLSNFLLWQMSYTEVYTTNVLWPDFGKAELLQAITEYQKRERRFGE